jgi:hypothetical protein
LKKKNKKKKTKKKKKKKQIATWLAAFQNSYVQTHTSLFTLPRQAKGADKNCTAGTGSNRANKNKTKKVPLAASASLDAMSVAFDHRSIFFL